MEAVTISVDKVYLEIYSLMTQNNNRFLLYLSIFDLILGIYNLINI